MSDKIAEIRARHEVYTKVATVLNSPTWTRAGWRAHDDRATLLAEIERLRAERDALRDAAREYLTTLGGAMKSGKFEMGGTAEMAHFVRQAMQKLDSLVFDRDGPRSAGLERLHEPLKRPS